MATKTMDQNQTIPAGYEPGEISVTPRMIAAGLAELREHHYDDDAEYMLECVYRAMAYASFSASSIRADI